MPATVDLRGLAPPTFLAPAAGRRFVACGRVLKLGRTLTVTTGEVVAETEAGQKSIATMMATMMAVSSGEISG